MSNFPINPVVLALVWLFYKFKSSKSNKLTDLFKKKRRFLITLRVFVRAFYSTIEID